MSTLGPLLENEGYVLSYASSKLNKIARLLDMLSSVFSYRGRIDVVLIDTYGTQNFYYALLVSQMCRLLRLPYIPILHGGTLPLRLKTTPKMSDLIFRNSKFNVAPSLYFKYIFEDHGYTNIKYIPNTIEIKNYVCLQRIYITPKLLWVRSFSEMYNPIMAVKVLKFLKDAGLEAELCMVGPDSDGSQNQVKQLAKDLNIQVTFTGKLTKKEWIILSKLYTVFINTTNIDNTPVSVIEAMALGLPIVSTNVGGIPFLIENKKHGILVKKNDVDAMAEAILYLYNNSTQRDIMITNARELAETFDWHRVKMQWNEILQN
jgi:glycosyltransferase involved in cell wall biosynthesis